MAVDFIQDSVDMDVGIKAQSVDANTFEQSVFNRLLLSNATFDFPSNEVVSEDIGDTGGPTGRRRIAKGGNADIQMHVRYEENKIPLLGVLRDVSWATELSYTGAGALGDIQYLTTGTHNDGATNQLQIKTALNALNALKSGVGKGLFVYVEDFTTSANNQPFMVKDVWDDGSNDIVDIFPGYGGGVAADPLGAPKTAEDSQAATLHFGEWIKNRRKGVGMTRVYSMMVDRYNLTGARRYRGLLGWVPNDWTLEIPDEGSARSNVTGMGRIWQASQATPPNGQAEGSHFVDPTNRDFVVGGEDLEFLSLVTYANAAVATNVPINLGDRFVTNFTFNVTGGVEAKSNILGMTGVVPKRGRFGFNGSFGYYVADDAGLGLLEDLGSPNLHQKAAMHCVFLDPDGNRWGVTAPRNEFAQTGGTGGGGGDETGQMEFGAEAVDNEFRTVVVQQWSGPIPGP